MSAPSPAGEGASPPSPPGEVPGAGETHSFIQTFPCAGCGAKLTYAPGTRSLACQYCGTANEIEERDARIEELDFAAFVAALEGREETMEEEMVRCAKCGAEQHLPDHHFAAHCSFCASPIVSASYARRHVKPRAVLPFQVDKRRAQDAFRRWVKGLWLAPAELKRYAQSDAALTGIYLPFWTYDCRTASDFTGERGEDYYTTETVRARNSAGKMVSQVRQVRHTRWHPAAGHAERFHDDVVVLAARSLPPTLRGAAAGWDLAALVPYQPEFVTGYRAQAYEIGLAEGYDEAKRTIDAQVYDLVRSRIGGDRQRVHHIDTRYSDVRFKHALLPVWISAYRFRDKAYRFLVNGQTGEVAGESPVSWQKVTLLVVVTLICLLLIVFFGAR